MADWPLVRLGEVMDPDVVRVPVQAAQSYSVVGVLNRGRGLLRRGQLDSSGTQYKHLNRVAQGQVIYSRLKAFEGSVTVAGDGDFPAFASRSEAPLLHRIRALIAALA